MNASVECYISLPASPIFDSDLYNKESILIYVIQNILDSLWKFSVYHNQSRDVRRISNVLLIHF